MKSFHSYSNTWHVFIKQFSFTSLYSTELFLELRNLQLYIYLISRGTIPFLKKKSSLWVLKFSVSVCYRPIKSDLCNVETLFPNCFDCHHHPVLPKRNLSAKAKAPLTVTQLTMLIWVLIPSLPHSASVISKDFQGCLSLNYLITIINSDMNFLLPCLVKRSCRPYSRQLVKRFFVSRTFTW